MSIIPEFITLAEMLEKLQGICGRTFLLEHLKDTPFYDGLPTHHRVGSKIVFYPEDVKVLLASFEPQPTTPTIKSNKRAAGDMRASPAARSAKARKLLERRRSKPKKETERRDL